MIDLMMVPEHLLVGHPSSTPLRSNRDKIVELLAQLQESLTLIDSLKTAIDKKHSSYDSVCGRGKLSLHSNL